MRTKEYVLCDFCKSRIPLYSRTYRISGHNQNFCKMACLEHYVRNSLADEIIEQHKEDLLNDFIENNMQQGYLDDQDLFPDTEELP